MCELVMTGSGVTSDWMTMGQDFFLSYLEQFSIEYQKWSGNHFGFGFTTVWDWMNSLIGK